MEVGQKIYLDPRNNAVRYSKRIRECTISKVGKKYLEVKEIYGIRFFKDTLEHDGKGYCSDYQGYLNINDLEDKKESEKLLSELRMLFTSYTTGISLIKLRKLHKIINDID